MPPAGPVACPWPAVLDKSPVVGQDRPSRLTCVGRRNHCPRPRRALEQGARTMKKFTLYQPVVRLADPHVWSDSKNHLSLRWAIYEPLAVPGPGGAYQPCLAERWESDPQGRVWTFRLRPRVVFHNGGALTAADVVASLERACSPQMVG
ncbi:MAG: hypothetical protein GX605_00430, partial [Chloroflexi bacterium]|nr:hypothetical protein [Chloroflexota bacterium]